MLPETQKLLDEFYSPFNIELAELMDDQRFLFERIERPTEPSEEQATEKVSNEDVNDVQAQGHKSQNSKMRKAATESQKSLNENDSENQPKTNDKT